MSDPLRDLAPRSVWGHFASLAAIPRPSGKEEAAAAFVIDTAKAAGASIVRDERGNVVARVPASKGREKAPTLILQSHLDMVCEKNRDVTHDFDRDPIHPRIDGEWVRATGTTLGADNGIGVAAALASATDPEAQHGPHICLAVKDTGHGMDAATVSRIFDPFFTTKDTGAGTGLGLSLAIGIVEAHGGHMYAENLPGAGARFTVYLPVGENIEAATSTAPGPPSTAVAPADVLVVEDEEPLRGLVVEVIHGLGHHVVEATTGHEALARLRERSYDLVVLDLRLPDVDGQAVWERALAPDPRLAARVVFMTGDIMSAETQGFLDEAGRPFLLKPFTMEEVGRVVTEVLAAPSR